MTFVHSITVADDRRSLDRCCCCERLSSIALLLLLDRCGERLLLLFLW
jgi:hypothetical protein